MVIIQNESKKEGRTFGVVNPKWCLHEMLKGLLFFSP